MVLPSRRLLIAEAMLRVELALTTTLAIRPVWRVRLRRTADENEEQVRRNVERGSMRIYTCFKGEHGIVFRTYLSGLKIDGNDRILRYLHRGVGSMTLHELSKLSKLSAWKTLERC